MVITRKAALCGAGLVCLLSLGAVIAGVVWAQGSRAASGGGEDPPAAEEGHIRVKTIHPRRDPSFGLTVEEPCYVGAYYQTDIPSQVAGRIKYIQVSIGDPIREGEVLALIDVPDLDQKVAEKEAFVEQRIREEQLAQKKAATARWAIDVAKFDWDLKVALVAGWEATCDLRLSRYKRFKGAHEGQLVTAEVLDEEKKNYLQAKSDCEAAWAASNKAKAEWEVAKANSEAAIADVKLKQALIEVARKDRDQAQADADYAKITAPYDGVVLRRREDINPGSFVQNATTGHTEPLLTVARTDIVTVFMLVPDNFAPFVHKNIEATIRTDQLPGEVIKGKVSRFSPSVDNQDRRMRVEVDLYNGSEEEYLRFKRKAVATMLAPVGIPHLKEAMALTAAARITWRQHRKSRNAFPLFPQITGQVVAPGEDHLLPGMTGYMRLHLANDNSFLLPSGAVFSRGGKMHICEVKNSKAHWVPVDVQADFGSLFKVALIVRRVNPKTGQTETVRQGLTGDQEIIVSGQGEIAEGQPVEAAQAEWPKFE